MNFSYAHQLAALSRSLLYDLSPTALGSREGVGMGSLRGRLRLRVVLALLLVGLLYQKNCVTVK